MEPMKDFSELGKAVGQKAYAPPTNHVGRFLSRANADYGRWFVHDVAKIMNVTTSAVSRQMKNLNGIGYENAQKLAFMFNTSLDDIVNTKPYRHPQRGTVLDHYDFCLHVLDVLPELKTKELMVDVSHNVNAYLHEQDDKARKYQEAPRPVQTTPTLDEPEPVVAKTLKAATPDGGDRNAIKMVLHQAEKFRQANNVEWFIKDDGSLGARRVTVEEF